MSIGTPVEQGHASSFSTATSNTITTLANINAGDTIFVLGYANTNSNTIASITDTAGNSYAQITQFTQSPGVMSLWSCGNSASMSSGGQITVNYNGSGSGLRYGCAAISISGLGVADIVPTTTTSSSSSVTSATSISTGTLNSANELVLGLINFGSDPGTLTPGGSFAQIGSGGTNAWPLISWQIVSSSASVSWAPSWVTARPYRSTVITFFAKAAQGFTPPDQTNPVRLSPAGISVRALEDRPKLMLVGKDVLFGVPGEPPTPPDISNPVLARPNLELRTWFQTTGIYFPMPVPGLPVDAPNPIPRRGPVDHPIAPNLAVTTITPIPFVPFYFENPLRAPFADAVVCNSAEPLDIIPPFKVKAPDNPRGYKQLVEYPIPPNLLSGIMLPQAFPFRTLYGNPLIRNAVETVRLGETLATNILNIIQQPTPPPDFQNPRGYAYPTSIRADAGFQSAQSLNLIATTPVGINQFSTDLPVRAKPSFINFDAAPANLLSGTLLPQPLPPGADNVAFADLPPRGYRGYSQYEVGSPNATATTLQTVFPPPGIPYPYEELYQYFQRPGLTFTSYMEGSQSSVQLGGALNIPPISDQLLDYFFATIAVRTAYSFLYDAGPPSQLGMVLAPVSAPPGDLYIKQHRMGAPGFPLMGEPH